MVVTASSPPSPPRSVDRGHDKRDPRNSRRIRILCVHLCIITVGITDFELLIVLYGNRAVVLGEVVETTCARATD